MSSRGRGDDFRGRGRGRGEYSDRGRGRGRSDYSDGGRGRGRGEYSDGGRGRGRGEYSDGGRGRGRGEYSDGGRGRGRGEYSDGGRGRGGGVSSAPRQQTERISVDDYMTRVDSAIIDSLENKALEGLGRLYGSSGKSVDIISNYFKIDFMSKINFSQYRVVFDPDVPSSRVRRGLLAMHRDVLGEPYTFDGEQLFMPRKLKSAETVFYSPNDPNVGTTRAAEAPVLKNKEKNNDDDIKITITFTNNVPSTSPRVIQIMNLVMRNVFRSLGYKQIKRHYFNPKTKIIMERENLEIWPGFQTSIVPFGNQLTLCADLAFHVVLKQTVFEKLVEYAADQENMIRNSKRDLIGKVVMTNYNNCTYKIDDIDYDKSVSDTFDKEDGSKISYFDYYKQHYGIVIRDKGQPLLTSYPKKKRGPNKKGEGGLKPIEEVESRPIYLVPELCLLTGLTDEMRNNFNLTRAMNDTTRRDPTQRSKELVKFIKSIYDDEKASQLVSKWGLKIEDKLMCIPGRNFGSEAIFADNKKELENVNCDWTRSLRDIPLLNPQKLDNWMVVFVEKDNQTVVQFLNMLIKASGNMNFHIKPPHMVPVRVGNAVSFKNAITQNLNRKVNMVMAVLDSPKKEVYDVVKDICCSQVGILSQCVLSKTLRKTGLGSIAMKIGIQMNVKLGGEAWYVSLPLQNTMVVGIDVCHDPKLKSNSYGAVVCSMNRTMTRFYSKITKNCGVMEIIDALGYNVLAALKNYKAMNGSYPDKIVIYRDGVGDGQFNVVSEHEVRSLKNHLQETIKPMPKIALVIVKKRIGSRFLTPSNQSFENPPPGTIIDKYLTKTDRPNFYLISQSVRQGTVNPTHYVVLHNETPLKTDHLQQLAYKLTHLYYNWSGTIRVPAPCQYAHKLCFLASNSIRSNLHASLENYLYYL